MGVRTSALSLVLVLSAGCGGGEPTISLDAQSPPTDAAPDGGRADDDASARPPDASQLADGGDLAPDAEVAREPTMAQRIAAATETATTNPACDGSALPEGFYWEIGDRAGALASGTIDGSNPPAPTDVIAIASASKWLYASYVLEKVGSLRDSDVPYLHFTSGQVYPRGSQRQEATCAATETVGECAADVTLTPAAVDRFYYSAGHFQYHATHVMGLGDLRGPALSAEISATLGDLSVTYLQTNLAGGANTSAATYTAFLRATLRGEKVMAAHLGSHAVCASAACASGAVLSPAPPDEAWNYSLGHWVEDDPVVGDHAFSSAGALGFYPWIDRTKTWYGVIARRARSTGGSQGVLSLRCGRLIRQAFVTGVPTRAPVPTPR